MRRIVSRPMKEVEDKIWSERWNLAALSADDFIRIGLTSIIAGLIFVMYHFQGNTENISAYGRSAFMWLVQRWNSPYSNFSHGWIIVPASIFLLWKKRDALAAAFPDRRVCRTGLAVVICALFFHWLGARVTHPRISLVALIMMLWGLPYYFWGWRVAKELIFPCAYLIFCIPLNFLDSLTFPLRIIATKMAVLLINGLGVAVKRVGSGIYSETAQGFKLDVADPCSGLRSLLAMTALTAVYAWFTQKTLLKKWILFICAVPLAIAGNIVRITALAMVAEAFGEDAATGLYHDYSGYIVFAVAIMLMVGLGNLLDRDYKKVWAKWKLEATGRISRSSS